MIKRGQIEKLEEYGFHDITAITKGQIETLIKQEVIQDSLFDDLVTEVIDNRIRYVLKLHTIRVKEIRKSRESKKGSIQALIEKKNTYLREHPKAQVKTEIKVINTKITQLKVQG